MNLITILRTKTNCNTALILHNITSRSTKIETKKKQQQQHLRQWRLQVKV